MMQREDSMTNHGFLFDEAFLSKLRIGSGLVLFVYILLHFINHAAGLVSLDALAAVGKVLKSFWRLWPMSLLLYGALAVHFIAALWRLYSRRSLRLSITEWVQIFLGVAIPFLLVVHVMGTRYASEVYGINDTYAYVLLSTMVFSPEFAWFNTFGLVAAWLHACIGLHMWLRTKPSYTSLHYEVGLVLAAMIPTASLAGYWVSGERIIPLAQDGEFMGNYFERLQLSSDAIWPLLASDTEVARGGVFGALVLVLVARVGRKLLQDKNKEVRIDYSDGSSARQSVGPSLLEISKLAEIPHASVCGGRGRCSTCRVQIIKSDGPLTPPSETEQKVLSRVNAPSDVRLACQLVPNCNMQVVRLLPHHADMNSSKEASVYATGRERVVTVMFADLRNFTRTAEQRLPYDVVFLINQFSQIMGEVIEENNGRIDKFLGDGFMALFGLDGDAKKSAIDALTACQAMVTALDRLNASLKGELENPLRIGIGIHTGSVVLGDMGYGAARSLTALGDPVNIASRLEQETKVQKKTICVSKTTLEMAECVVPKKQLRTVKVRGRAAKIDICALNETRSLLN